MQTGSLLQLQYPHGNFSLLGQMIQMTLGMNLISLLIQVYLDFIKLEMNSKKDFCKILHQEFLESLDFNLTKHQISGLVCKIFNYQMWKLLMKSFQIMEQVFKNYRQDISYTKRLLIVHTSILNVIIKENNLQFVKGLL